MLLGIIISVIAVIAITLFVTLKWDCLQCRAAHLARNAAEIEAHCGQALCGGQ